MPLNPAGALTQYRTQIDANELAISQNISDIAALHTVDQQIMSAPSSVTQQPGATDSPLQLTFGTGQSVPEISLDALGAFSFLVTDEYRIQLRLNFGRTGAPGVALVYGRALVDGVQIGNSVHAQLDDGDFSVPATFDGIVPLSAGSVLTVEILRSSAGFNAGGVFAEPSPLSGWSASPSALMTISKTNLMVGP